MAAGRHYQQKIDRGHRNGWGRTQGQGQGVCVSESLEVKDALCSPAPSSVSFFDPLTEYHLQSACLMTLLQSPCPPLVCEMQAFMD
jgi:hypothetical protein